MNPSAKGLERLFNDEDRRKLRAINDALRDHLEDVTAEDNDFKYGYVSGASTAQVPVNRGFKEVHTEATSGSLMNKFAHGLMEALAGGTRTLVA